MSDSSQGAPTAAAEAQASDASHTALPDVVAAFRDPIVELMVQYADRVLDYVAERKGLNVDDVRHELLGPTKTYLQKPGDAKTHSVQKNDSM